MVHVLGVNLPDNFLARHAFTNFLGVGRHISHRLCARLQVHDRCKVKNLTPAQVTALASFLSSPSTAPALPRLPLAKLDYKPPTPDTPLQQLLAQFNSNISSEKLSKGPKGTKDPLNKIRVEAELRREVRENIAHQRMIGSYVGKRHAMHLPVRGQSTRTNAKIARKLNQLDRY